ncbi:MAG: DUF4124 domain-containing protein [Desulfobacteraceae bacterium]|jgi:hypothetical protein
MKKTALLLLPLIICLCGPVSAEFYKYTDQDGNVRFTDDLSKVPADQRPNVTSYDESRSAPPAAPAKETEPGQRSPEQKPKTGISADAQGKQLEKKRSDLEKEYQTLMEEKSRLEAEWKNAKTVIEKQKINEKKVKLNEKISQYEKKRNDLNTEIEAYNARRAQDNKDEKK